MATITPGTGGTIKSPKIESHLLEIITFARVQELNTVLNTGNKNYIQGFTYTDALFRCNLSIPVLRVTNETGESVTSVPAYITGVTFVPGSEGTFKSANFAAYLVETVLYAQDLERDTAKNPAGADRITGNFDINPNVFSASIEIPVFPSIASDGRPTYTAVEYLLT